MSPLAILVFGAAAYAVFLATFLYLIAFLSNLPATGLGTAWPWIGTLVPHTVDAGNPTGNTVLAIATDILLVVAFGLQHSVMARSGFKAWLTRSVPRPVERSVYVLASSLCLVLMFWLWRPLPTVIWQAESYWGIALGWTTFAAGVLLVLVATFLIDHFDLFGLKQTWRQYVGRSYSEPGFITPWLYRYVRHPLYVGWILTFWGAPTMTVGHALFASSMSIYILVAIGYEERDLVRAHGERYVRYRAAVPALIPFPGRRWLG
jgi:protein-S-isoprenylcysteine O-methyltransferase Ste14